MADASLSQSATVPEPGFGDYVTLLKPRVMRLVVFTAVVGLVCAPVTVHPVIALAAVICIAVGAGAAPGAAASGRVPPCSSIAQSSQAS